MPESAVMLSEREDEMWQVKNAAYGTHTRGLGSLLLINVLIIGVLPVSPMPGILSTRRLRRRPWLQVPRWGK
jgi:hypothetical protein